MKINSPLIFITLRNALIATILAGSILIILYYAGNHPFLIPVYADFRIFLFAVFIFFSLKEYRDRHKQSLLYFWQGMVGSYLFLLFFALCSGASILIFASLQQNFVTDYITLFTEQAKGLPPERIQEIGKENLERSLTELQKTNAFEMAKLYFMQSITIGFFISIIISIILRKQPKL